MDTDTASLYPACNPTPMPLSIREYFRAYQRAGTIVDLGKAEGREEPRKEEKRPTEAAPSLAAVAVQDCRAPPQGRTKDE